MAYTKIKNFRFWCQKVLPVVYDDSLSYYEVLCKIRDYINDIISNMDELAEAIEDLDSRLDAVEDELNNLSQIIIDEVKRYIQSDEFVSQLIEGLTSSHTFNNWFHDFITENPELIQHLINSQYFDEYFNDYITNNPDIVNSLLSNPNFISNFTDVMSRQTDFYDISTISDGDISKGGLVSNFYAIGKNSQIAAGTRLKVMYRPTLTPIVGKFERTSSGGFYNWASDGDTAYTSFIIDMNGFDGRNLYVKIDEAFDPYSYTFIKRGSLDTGGVSVTSDKGTPTGQASYIPGDYLKLEPTKSVNFVLISIKNNGVAFNPTFTYSMRNVDFDSNTDTPVLIPFNAFEVWDGSTDTAISTLELFKPDNELAYIIFGAIGSTQYGLSEDIASVDSQVSNLQEDMVDLKNSVSDGKALVASAITDKGVATTSNATFNTMANNILSIPTGDVKPGGLFTGGFIDITNNLDTLVSYGFKHIPSYSSLINFYDALIDAGVYCKPIYSQDVLSYFIICADSSSEVGIKVSETSSNYYQYDRYFNQQSVTSPWSSTTGTQECYVYTTDNGTTILIPLIANKLSSIDAYTLIIGHCYNVNNRLSFYCDMWFGENTFLYDGCTQYNQGSFTYTTDRLNRSNLTLVNNFYGVSSQSSISSDAVFTFFDLFVNRASPQTTGTERVKSYLFVGDNDEVFFLPSSLTTSSNNNMCFRIK